MSDGRFELGTSQQKLLIDIEELSDLTGFSTGTLYHWVSQKRIPVVRISARCVRFRVSDVEAWLVEKVQPVNNASATHPEKYRKKTIH